MIEISFWKIIVVMVVALVVLGPEQLPKVARTIGRLVAKMRGTVSAVQKELDAISREDEKPPSNQDKSE